jgi:hypothetical protein
MWVLYIKGGRERAYITDRLSAVHTRVSVQGVAQVYLRICSFDIYPRTLTVLVRHKDKLQFVCPGASNQSSIIYRVCVCACTHTSAQVNSTSLIKCQLGNDAVAVGKCGGRPDERITVVILPYSPRAGMDFAAGTDAYFTS